MNNMNPFQPPSNLWIWVLGPFFILSGTWTFRYANLFINAVSPSVKLKLLLVIGIISLFCSVYLIAGYLYLQWVAPKKNLLYQLVAKRPDLLYEKYNRIFIDTKQLQQHDIDPASFKRIQQRDYRDVIRKKVENTRIIG